ncbi:MAG: lysophospholipid acyltransferase family protein [Trueperaceae bacterium]|nr:lysophospholipid acyltransferase family protein [Trueperaceae bacterium]
MIAYLGQRLSAYLELGIAYVLPFLIERSLRRGLHRIYFRGNWDNLANGGVILAPNHHSWWDVYLAWYLHLKIGRKAGALMDEAQLERFRFFRHIGIISRRELREAIRRLERGDLFFVFPEGELRQNGPVATVERGVFFLARAAHVPIYPVAFRVVMRGAEHPEAFISLGERLELSGDDQADKAQLKAALTKLLKDIDTCVTETHPEKAPEGFTQLMGGQKSTSERTAWLGKLWL